MILEYLPKRGAVESNPKPQLTPEKKSNLVRTLELLETKCCQLAAADKREEQCRALLESLRREVSKLLMALDPTTASEAELLHLVAQKERLSIIDSYVGTAPARRAGQVALIDNDFRILENLLKDAQLWDGLRPPVWSVASNRPDERIAAARAHIKSIISGTK